MVTPISVILLKHGQCYLLSNVILNHTMMRPNSYIIFGIVYDNDDDIDDDDDDDDGFVYHHYDDDDDFPFLLYDLPKLDSYYRFLFSGFKEFV